MKKITKVIAVMLMVVVLASLIAACGQDKGYMDTNILGTWKQTDEIDGNWTWTFNDDNTCRLVGETNGFDSEGTFKIENETNGKIHIKLKDWDKEQLFSYAVTPKVLSLESIDFSYRCYKQ